MKPDTFDIPAYKFGLLKLNGDALKKGKITESALNNAINAGIRFKQLNLIPFEDVDGLLTSEVRSLLKIEGPLILVYYIGYKSYTIQESGVKFIGTTVLDDNFIERYPGKTIDELFEIAFENNYRNLTDENLKKAANCFFERYQDNTHQDTIKRINKLV